MTDTQPLSENFGDNLLDILTQISALQNSANRDRLLRGLPSGPVGAILRNDAWQTDLHLIVEAAEGWRELISGQSPLAIIAKNTLPLVEGTQFGQTISAFLTTLAAQGLTTWPEIQIHNLPEPSISPEPSSEGILDCPYRGLFAFRPENTGTFFGRDTFTAQLVQAVSSRNLVTVLGASGSGKSSVIFAGLVPALAKRSNERWLFTHFRPGNDPFFGLAGALVPLLYDPDLDIVQGIKKTRTLAIELQEEMLLADVIKQIEHRQPDTRLLLIADQFEELYTLCKDVDSRQQFLDQLLALRGSVSATSLSLALTLRADFLGQASLYRPFADALQDTIELLGPMSETEMRETIEKPADLQGVRFEAKLIGHLLADVGQEEGSLPLLEFALTELWHQQHQGQLSHVAYAEMGRVRGALSRHANQVYQRLTAEEQQQARRIFVQLVTPGAGTEDTRRVARQTELAADWSLVAKLAGERLVVTNKDQAEADKGETVEVVHEALIQNWGQLKHWMEADRDFRSWQESLRIVLHQWQETKSKGDLLRGTLLAVAEERLIDRSADLSEAERVFIQASVALREKEVAEQEEQHQRELDQQRALAEEQRKRADTQARTAAQLHQRAIWLSGALILAIVAIITTVWFGQQANNRRLEVEYQRRQSLSRELATQATFYRADDPQLALLLAMRAVSATYSVDGYTTFGSQCGATRSNY